MNKEGTLHQQTTTLRQQQTSGLDPQSGLKPRQTGRLTVGRSITVT
jgi:hypothetical protein